jgi:hypothetical protein
MKTLNTFNQNVQCLISKPLNKIKVKDLLKKTFDTDEEAEQEINKRVKEELSRSIVTV